MKCSECSQCNDRQFTSHESEELSAWLSSEVLTQREIHGTSSETLTDPTTETVSTEMTKSKQTEEALPVTEEEYRLVVENANDPIFEEPSGKSEMGSKKSKLKRVLLMDDEEMLRFLAKQMLTRLGYEAELAKNGDEAIELYKTAASSSEPFDAVILDMTVPNGMGGQEAVLALLDMDPDVKAVACTGYLEDPVMSSPQEYGFSSVLAKPFLKKDLGVTLEKLLIDATT
jgi:CheY-like chemotaxis protein